MDYTIPPAAYINSVNIDGLFGEVDIDLTSNKLADPRLLILYGPNGSGKTTLLELIESLISPENGAGHRTRLAQIPFSKASISFDGGCVVEAKKRDGLTGSYDWIIRKPGVDPIYMHLKSVRGRIQASNWDTEQSARYESMVGELQSLVKRVELLDDKRTFYVPDSEQRSVVERRLSDGRIVHIVESDVQDDENDPVNRGLTTIVSSVRREALLLSNRGNQGAQSIYTSLVNRVISTPQGAAATGTIEYVASQLQGLQARSKNLSTYGLVPPIDHAPLLHSISDVDSGNESIVVNILSPYVESISARLNAIQSLHDALNGWVENLRRFLFPKTIHFMVGEKIEIRSRVGRVLPAKDLSSGERHLLLLLTKAFQFKSTGGILMIDEPELSLNSSWQRELIQALIEAFAGSGCQLIVASHSLEIASRYEANVLKFS